MSNWHAKGRVGTKRAAFNVGASIADNDNYVFHITATDGCTIMLTIQNWLETSDRLEIGEESIVCKLSDGTPLRCTGFIDEDRIRLDAHIDEQENYAWFWLELRSGPAFGQ
jgi:hypothetical protein